MLFESFSVKKFINIWFKVVLSGFSKIYINKFILYFGWYENRDDLLVLILCMINICMRSIKIFWEESLDCNVVFENLYEL